MMVHVWLQMQGLNALHAYAQTKPLLRTHKSNRINPCLRDDGRKFE
jgi:hypothetical protein